MSNGKFDIHLDINNIGPHHAANNISFTDSVDSNKALFYAANGVGKSFISRAFRAASIDKRNENADDLLTLGYDNGSLNFKIVNSTVNKNISVNITRGSIPNIQDNSNFIFHIFNSDYVEENIKPQNYTPDGSISGYILGKTQIDLSKEKSRKATLYKKLTDKSQEIDSKVSDAISELKKLGVVGNTSELSFIQRDMLLNHNINEDIQSFDIIVEQLNTLSELPNDLDDVSLPKFDFEINNQDSIKTLLTTSYPKTDWDEEFVSEIKKNRDFYEKGVFLVDKNTHCPFCKQDLSLSALEVINAYKSFLNDKEATILKNIENCKKSITDKVELIKNSRNALANANLQLNNLKRYFPSLNSTSLIIPSDEDISSTENALEKITEVLELKYEDLSFAYKDTHNILDNCVSEIERYSQIFQENFIIISKINKTKQETNSERLQLRRNLCKAQFIKYKSNLSSDFKDYATLQASYNDLSEEIIQKEYQMRISKKDKVYESLTFFLDCFFQNKYAIEKDTFEINFMGNLLGTKVSKILSDGEKSIVSFCYYLATTHLLVQNQDDYENLFFIIDDPISSMDFHYVYSIAQTINSLKEYFDITTNIRVWVFTHNLEFFSILSRNGIITKTYVIRPGSIDATKQELLLPYENHLQDIYDIANGNKSPSHTTGNSIRHVIETVCQFEYPDKNLEKYITENYILNQNSCIHTLCQDLSHGGYRFQHPFSPSILKCACQCVIDFMTNNYNGQIVKLRN